MAAVQQLQYQQIGDNLAFDHKQLTANKLLVLKLSQPVSNSVQHFGRLVVVAKLQVADSDQSLNHSLLLIALPCLFYQREVFQRREVVVLLVGCHSC